MSVERGYLTKDFILVWQGHFVSAVGTVVYGIALGFWVLEITGSTTWMGLVSASAVIPRLLVGPWAGAAVDRSDRRTILVITDLVAGFVMLAVALLAFAGILPVWAAVLAGLAIGTTESFSRPAIQSALPLIVPTEELGRANAAYSAAHSGSDLLGRFLGGFLFKLVSVPVIFFLNALSYFYSAIAEFFIRPLPQAASVAQGESYAKRIIDGARRGFAIPGLFPLFVIIAFLNFFGFMVVTFYVPLFARGPGLGAMGFGIVMAFSTGGSLLGDIILSRVPIGAARRPLAFCLSGTLSNLFIIVFPFAPSLQAMTVLVFLSGLTSAPINAVLSAALQLSIPSAYQGRVFAFVGMVGGFLVPAAMICAGAIAETADPALMIALCGAVLSVLFAVAATSGKLRAFLRADTANKAEMEE